MDLSITGKLYKVLPEQSGDGKNGRWVKQNFVIETQDSFPKKICFVAWGDKTNIVKNLKLDQTVKVTFAVESREYQDKWYTDVKAVEIETTSGQSISGPAETPPMISDPFQGGNTSGLDNFAPTDDLPF